MLLFTDILYMLQNVGKYDAFCLLNIPFVNSCYLSHPQEEIERDKFDLLQLLNKRSDSSNTTSISKKILSMKHFRHGEAVMIL